MGVAESSTRNGLAHADAQGIGSIGPRVGRVLAPETGMRTAALALLVALAACGPMRGPSGQPGKGLSVRQPLSQQTAVALSAGSGPPRTEAPDLHVTLGLLYSF